MIPETNSARQNESSRRAAAMGRSSMSSRRAPALTVAALSALALLATASAQAQVTAQFSVAQIPVPTGSLSYPYRVAVDAAGDVYISDTQHNRVLKETLATNGGYTEAVIVSTGLATPYGVAVDSTGNVYVADNGHNRVLREAPSGNTYVQTVVPTTTLSYPTGVAMDSSGNLYICDTGHTRILKETPTGGSYVEAVISSSGLDQIVGITVDSTGNVFVSDIDSMQVYKETLAAGSYTQSTIPTSGLNYPYDVAVDANDNLYISDFANTRIVEEAFFAGSYVQSVYPTADLSGGLGLAVDATGDVYLADTLGQTVWKSSPAGGNFGPVNVGTASSVGYVIFSFVGSGGPLSLGGMAVLTQGASGSDFTNSGDGSCVALHPYNAGDTCSLGAFIIPQFPAQRLGAAAIYDTSINIVASGYLSATGIGPELNFQPGTLGLVAESDSLNPQGLAVDAGGNVYFADFANDQVLKVTPLGVKTTVADSTSGMGAPESVAVDGAGNILIADSRYSQILMAAPSGGTYTYITIAGPCFDDLRSPRGVAVDGFGNVYVADTDNNRILKETPAATTYTQSVIPTTGLPQPFAVAVDIAGNLYIADLTNNRIVLETLSGGVYTQSTIVTGLSEPTSVFVDVNGNLYIADYGSYRILKETLSAGAYTQSVIVNAPGISFYGVALDGGGNLYGTDVTGGLVFDADVVDPPVLSFASSDVGTQSSDSPTSVTVLNFGNASLYFPIPDTGTNPHFSAASFTLDDSTTCPQVSSFGPAAGLAANLDCVYAINFSPAAAGPISDALVLVDYNLNSGNSVQTIAVSGTGLTVSAPATTVLTLTALPVATSPFGQSVTLTATLAPFAGGGQSTNGELVTFKNGATSLGTGTLASGVASLTLTTLPAGVDSLSAAYAGDLNVAASTSVALSYTVSKITPVITWATPVQITFGTALSSTQLDATSLVAGTFVYTPPAGTTPAAGTDTLSVTFTPTDTVTYSNATASVTLAVFDFTITAAGGAATQSVSPGAAATFPFTAAPEGALTFPDPVTFSVTGLPPGATAVFTPATIPAGSPSTPVTLVVQTSAAVAAVVRESMRGVTHGSAPVELALLFLPILGLQAFRKRFRLATSTRAAVLLATLAVGAVVGLSGCTGSTHIDSTSYPLAVTATSGTLHTSFNITLIVNK
jgi:streptogramin lyase